MDNKSVKMDDVTETGYLVIGDGEGFREHLRQTTTFSAAMREAEELVKNHGFKSAKIMASIVGDGHGFRVIGQIGISED